MEKNIEITKIPRTDAEVDNSVYIAKVPVTETDDFGNEYTYFKKQEINKEALLTEKDTITARLSQIDMQLAKCEEADKLETEKAQVENEQSLESKQ